MRTIVVTGGASGIGAAVTAHLRALGDRVAVLDRTEGADLVADVRDEPAVRAALARVEAETGPVDAVVHSAALAQHGELVADLPTADFAALVDVNLVGSYVVARAAADLMRPRGTGSIVLLSSPSSFRARPGMAAYSASKAGVVALAKCLAVELGGDGIRVNCVSPGVTLTPLMLDSWGADGPDDAFVMANAQARIPIGRLAVPEEVATAVAYLVSTDAAMITGHDLVVDGGRSL